MPMVGAAFYVYRTGSSRVLSQAYCSQEASFHRVLCFLKYFTVSAEAVDVLCRLNRLTSLINLTLVSAYTNLEMSPSLPIDLAIGQIFRIV